MTQYFRCRIFKPNQATFEKCFGDAPRIISSTLSSLSFADGETLIIHYRHRREGKSAMNLPEYSEGDLELSVL